jgi:hypothetical protein
MNMMIRFVEVSGIDAFLRYAQYPKSIDTNTVLEELKPIHSKLAHAPNGSGHDCALKGITVTFELTAPSFFWQQIQRYHFVDIISSQSKMHKILTMDIEKQCNEYVDKEIIEILKRKINLYDKLGNAECKSEWFMNILSNVPMGLELSAGMVTNYLQLKTIYHQRKHHTLDMWSKEFCGWIENLPMFKELIL